ncbi:MAG: ABC transporter permease [Trueperaceae bacterium]|nr:ABC transporter permease [Trueperaceae bacterium]
MSVYLIRRAVNTLVVLVGVATLAFFLVRLTGDPVTLLLPLNATPEAIAKLRSTLGLDRPLWVQYLRYLESIVKGDFGNSMRFSLPAFDLFKARFPATLELVGIATAVAVLLGIPFGVVAAASRGSVLDALLMGLAALAQAVPGFYLGLMLMLLFSVELGWLPTGGRGSWQQLVMPVAVLSSFLIALLARMTRSACLEVAGQDFIRTGRAKGIGEARLLLKHVLKNALIPIITLIGLQVGTLFSGAVVTETIFSWPGIARLALDGIYSRDYPIVQVVVVMSASIFVFINLLVDIIYIAVDPRIKYG